MSDLCQLSDVQAWLGVTAPTAPQTAILGRMITAASALVCNYCGRGPNGFQAQAYTDTYDGYGKPWMLLRQWPVSAVTSIGLMDCGTVTTITDATKFTLEQPIPAGGNQRLTLLGYYSFPRGRGNVTITYTAGYAIVPFDVAQATIEIVGEAYRRKDRIGQVSTTLNQQSTVSFSQADMNASIKTMLTPYRRLVPC